MKKIRCNSLILLLLIVTLLPLGSFANASGSGSPEITVSIDGRFVSFDVPPQMINGRVMVPLRPIFEGLGAKVEWNDKTQTVTGNKGSISVVLILNEKKATVNGKTIALDAPSAQIKGRTFVPARFVAESLGADVKWNDTKQQVIITTGAEIVTLDNYFFVYNSSKVNATDLDAIRKFSTNFKSTNNIIFDASQYTTAPKLYDALKAEQKKLGGKVAGIQIFGLASDVPSFSYVHKMKPTEGNFEWNGIEYDKSGKPEKFVSDLFYSNFKNDSKYLTDVTVYGIIQENQPVNIVPEWPISRLPLTKGEISKYISNYESYRKQIEGKSIPTVALSAPVEFQKGLDVAQDDIGFFMNRMKEEKEEFGYFSNTDLRTYYKDLAVNLTKENKSGVMDLVVGSDGDTEGATLKKDRKNYFFDRKSVASLNSNYYTAFFWGSGAANGLNANSIIHDGMAKGTMINPIAFTIATYNRDVANYLWLPIPTPEGETGDNWHGDVAVTKELLKENNPFFFVYKYYEAIESGKTRLQSFYEAQVAYAKLSVDNKKNLRASLGYENIISIHYLGLADY
ncbi:copper amine oxidase N-terminal domain-containing protein [Paenibacillus endoradicis]|uniref:copper amine oxidase N-terminal domain-containing protein n=1 Tax=Paenibacillus endoradicis TaxID=2972487 RepID=UPI0021594366|nr:copper amine oxidase N-terminal domain-containing protein [Paenibacillus endoradicis]MCR8656912.1 copper amine oxidase N-terminal domain-containing protein [Paenibacillus endoradicis]